MTSHDEGMKDPAAVVHDLAEVWNSRDVERIPSLFTTDARFEDVAFGVERKGLDEIRAMFLETWTGIPDLRTELTRVIADGPFVASEWALTGTHAGDFPELPATGESFAVAGVSITEVRDGRIRRQRDYYDRAAFLEQLGLIEPS